MNMQDFRIDVLMIQLQNVVTPIIFDTKKKMGGEEGVCVSFVFIYFFVDEFVSL